MASFALDDAPATSGARKRQADVTVPDNITPRREKKARLTNIVNGPIRTKPLRYSKDVLARLDSALPSSRDRSRSPTTSLPPSDGNNDSSFGFPHVIPELQVTKYENFRDTVAGHDPHSDRSVVWLSEKEAAFPKCNSSELEALILQLAQKLTRPHKETKKEPQWNQVNHLMHSGMIKLPSEVMKQCVRYFPGADLTTINDIKSMLVRQKTVAAFTRSILCSWLGKLSRDTKKTLGSQKFRAGHELFYLILGYMHKRDSTWVREGLRSIIQILRQSYFSVLVKVQSWDCTEFHIRCQGTTRFEQKITIKPYMLALNRSTQNLNAVSSIRLPLQSSDFFYVENTDNSIERLTRTTPRKPFEYAGDFSSRLDSFLHGSTGDPVLAT